MSLCYKDPEPANYFYTIYDMTFFLNDTLIYNTDLDAMQGCVPIEHHHGDNLHGNLTSIFEQNVPILFPPLTKR